jgi:hypothetical protein
LVGVITIDDCCNFLCSVLKRFIPGKARTRPYYLEVALRLPARCTTEISVEFDYVFLKWQEYPPDANHGFYIGAAVITALLPMGRNYTGLPQDGSTITSRYFIYYFRHSEVMLCRWDRNAGLYSI